MIIGVDPGIKGGIALIEPTPPHTSLHPITAFGTVLDLFADPINTTIYIEDQSAVSGQGGIKITLVEFGKLIGIAEGKGYKTKIVTPRSWYKYLEIPAGMDRKKRKQLTADRMATIYPSMKTAFYGPRGGLLDGMSDALAIAHYGYSLSS